MKRIGAFLLAASCATLFLSQGRGLQPNPRERHIRNIRQLTAGGENAEAYFSQDGKQIIFQSTRDPYKCDQIFTMDTGGGIHAGLKLVSTGKGPHDMRLLHRRWQPHYLCIDAPGITRLPAQSGPGRRIRVAAI